MKKGFVFMIGLLLPVILFLLVAGVTFAILFVTFPDFRRVIGAIGNSLLMMLFGFAS